MRSVAEIAVGALFAIGAVFNAVYTLRHGKEFFGDLATKAWLRPAGRMVERLIVPRATVFTLVLIAFQGAVALAVLTRGDAATSGLVAGGVFALVVAVFSSPAGAAANLGLAALLLGLALTR